MKRKKIGLALGSGGTRGFAHIGVLKALKEANIPIDYLVGCSAGAVVGAYYAVHGEIEGFESVMLKMSRVEFASFIDIRAPRKSLIRGNKMAKFLDEIYLKSSFKNTQMPFRVVTVDLRKGCEVDLKSGNLAQAVLASSSLPGIFPPIQMGKKLLIDGGVLNPTPVDILKKMGADIVLGVDLTMKGVSNLKSPNIFEVLMRSFDVLRTETAKSAAKKVNTDMLIIKPKINKDLSFMGYFNERLKVISEGERVTKQALPKIKELMLRS